VTSGSPDVLRVAVRIYYDPLVLDSSGARLDGTAATPVKNAVKQFLTTLPFNGLFILNSLVGAIEAVEGVRIAEIVLAEATYASLPFTPVTVEYLPDAGYLALDEVWFDSHSGYVSHGPI
jgi:hypothetical protein